MNWLNDPIPSYHKKWNARFVGKNRRFLSSILNSVLYQQEKELFTTLTPLTKTMVFLLIIVTILLQRAVLPLWVLTIGLLSILAIVSDTRMRALIGQFIGLAVIPTIIYLPSFFLSMGSLLTLWKILLQIGWVTIFINSMTMSHLIDVLVWLRLPHVVIFQIDTTFKYIYLLAVQLSKQLDTISLRLTGPSIPMKVGTHLIGTLFLKAMAYMTDLSHAMVLRGSRPIYRRKEMPLKPLDWALLIGCLCLTISFFTLF